MKKGLIYAALAATLTACTADEYLGQDNVKEVTEQPVPINIGYRTSAMTRASQQGMEEINVGTFRLYGTKGSTGIQVFNNYLVWHTNYNNSETTSKYWDYVGSKDESVTPYVGTEPSATAATAVALPNNQDLKYWDYEQPSYHFWAVAPWDDKVTFNVGSTATVPGTKVDGNITRATLTNVGGHLNPNTGTAQSFTQYYITNPTKVERDSYNNTVTLVFKRTGARVRVGFYETIKGYAVKDMKFWNVRVTQKGNSMKVKGTESDNVTLNRTDYGFMGNATSAPGTMYIDYDNTNDEYTVSYDDATVTSSRHFYAGSFAGQTISTSSATPTYGTDADMEAGNGYFSVLPTPTEFGDYNTSDPSLNGTARPIYLVCDFTLQSLDGSEEDIHVKGARAQIPAEYTTWKPNTAYTYLLRISQNTNGTTGNVDPTVPEGSDPSDPGVDPEDPDHPDPVDPTDPDNPDDPTDPGYDPDVPNLPEPPTPPAPGTADESPEGLYVITFDAVVEEFTDENLQGTTTTVATPSITTYQNGVDVEATGLIYKAGTDITISAMYGATAITTGINWVKLPGAYDYSKTYEQNTAGLTFTPGNKITAPTAGTYVIKVTGNINGAAFTGYKTVVVGAADSFSE